MGALQPNLLALEACGVRRGAERRKEEELHTLAGCRAIQKKWGITMVEPILEVFVTTRVFVSSDIMAMTCRKRSSDNDSIITATRQLMQLLALFIVL